MRRIVFAFALAWAGPAFGQGFDGSINSMLFGNLNSGLGGGLTSGFGPQIRSPAILDADRFDPNSDRDAFKRLEQERQGINVLGCAPGQVDINRSGCVPIRDALTRPPSVYDRSVQGLAPLTGLTIDQTLAPMPGPRDSVD